MTPEQLQLRELLDNAQAVEDFTIEDTTPEELAAYINQFEE